MASKTIGIGLEAKAVSNNMSQAFSQLKNSYYWKCVELNLLKINFDNYKNQWLKDIKYESNPIKISSHWAYCEIIKMGKNVLPFILTDLKENNNFWFEALNQITHENPVCKEHRGSIPEMVNDWLKFAENKYGFIFN